MKYLVQVTTTFVLAALLYLISPRPAYAYLDPGTGSYILQLALAALVGAGFAVKLFWKQIKAFFARMFSKEGEREETQD